MRPRAGGGGFYESFPKLGLPFLGTPIVRNKDCSIFLNLVWDSPTHVVSKSVCRAGQIQLKHFCGAARLLPPNYDILPICIHKSYTHKCAYIPSMYTNICTYTSLQYPLDYSPTVLIIVYSLYRIISSLNPQGYPLTPSQRTETPWAARRRGGLGALWHLLQGRGPLVMVEGLGFRVLGFRV